MALLRAAGIVLAATGAAHFAAPKAFEPISRLPFPQDTQAWIKRNGATELALGVALAVDKTRKAGLVGTAVYAAWLGARTVSKSRSA
ncbi:MULTISPECIES: hypothetical protein [Actinomadura]|jgi:uncharacterized membrane protein|uniref:DoxX family membrane protein n=1 Tax=Actinomadura geliboluensis TaxID=882440 RepID=A0A5S4H5D9_9ACTN|nr:hypothetical protein [Actinomadura geliboluensis]TMR39931.1 hypothetical protein ETD96_13365 [Actinomadura geliboluensis]